VTFAVAIVGCAILLLWDRPFRMSDHGVRDAGRGIRVLALTAIASVVLDLVVIGLSLLPECGLGICPDEPADISGLGDVGGWFAVLALGVVAFVVGWLVDRRWSRAVGTTTPEA
jgi:hypothetical protein